MTKLAHHVTKFSEKVRMMNDTNSKSLTLSESEARSLHTDIFALLAKIAELSTHSIPPMPSIVSINMDGGEF